MNTGDKSMEEMTGKAAEYEEPRDVETEYEKCEACG